jgi:pyruvate/2-oxoglutarate dehydrogenase complex dihydrolipoamide dehydrogenase (E3) component
VRLDAEEVIADEVVIDTGTRSLIPAIEGLSEVRFIHAGNWLAMPSLPAHLAMIGGGAIGLEMAQFFRRMGSRVTVIEGGDQVAGHEDADIGNALKTALEAEGIEFRLKTSVARIEAHGRDLRLTLNGPGTDALGASHIFVATGRKPNTDDLGLEKVGVAVFAHGIINADERLSTNVRGIWAAGDIRGGPQFTHTAWDDYRVLMSQIAGDGSRTTRRIVPYAIFTDPELGRAGMTETEALQAGHRVKVGRFDMKNSPKAVEIGQAEGFIKVVIDAETGLILGAAVLAAEGGEIVHCYVDLMNARSPYTVLRDAIHIHPTLCEAIQSAVSTIH